MTADVVDVDVNANANASDPDDVNDTGRCCSMVVAFVAFVVAVAQYAVALAAPVDARRLCCGRC